MGVFLQNTGGTEYNFGKTGYTSMGLAIHTGHILIGEYINTISWFLKDAGGSSSGGPIRTKIYSDMNPLKNAPSLLATSNNSVNADELTIGSIQKYDFQFPTAPICADGDMFAMVATDTNAANSVLLDNDDGSGMSNAQEARTQNTWTTYESMIAAQPRIEVTYGSSPPSAGGATFFPPPPAHVRL